MNKNRVLIIIICFLVIWNVLLTRQLINITNNNGEIINQVEVSGISSDLTKVVENTKAKTVLVEGAGYGSGFIYKSQADKFYVVTCAHVVGSQTTVYLNNSLKYDAKLLGKDIYSDIAVLEVVSDLTVPTISLGDNSRLKDGEFLIATGYPGDNRFNSSSELCMVSSKLVTVLNSISDGDGNYTYNEELIQLSSDLKSGYSGSGLFNMNNELVGMIVMKSDGQTFGITSNEIGIVADRIIYNVEINKLQLGIKGLFINEMPNYLKTGLNISLDSISGMYIENVSYFSKGHDLGLKTGDIIIKINDYEISSIKEYETALYNALDDYTITILRNNEELVLIGSSND